VFGNYRESLQRVLLSCSFTCQTFAASSANSTFKNELHTFKFKNNLVSFTTMIFETT